MLLILCKKNLQIETEITSLNSNMSKFILFSILSYFCYILLITFLFWGNFLLNNKASKEGELTTDFQNMLINIINNSNTKKISIFYIVIFILKKIFDKFQKESLDQYKVNLKKYMNNFKFYQIQKGLFFNYENAREIVKNITKIELNYLKITSIIENGIIKISTNMVFFVIIFIVIFIKKESKNDFWINLLDNIGVPLIVLVCLFFIFYIIFNIFFSRNIKLKDESLQNSIENIRKFNLNEFINFFNSKTFKIFENNAIFSIYIFVIGVLIPLILFINNYESDKNNLYMILAIFYILTNIDNFKFIYSYLFNKKEIKELKSKYEKTSTQKELIGNISIKNLNIKSANEIINSLTLEKNKIYEFIGIKGKTSLIKQMVGLKKLSKDQSVIFNYDISSHNLINPEFSYINQSILFINPMENPDTCMTIRDLFQAQNPNITDGEIFEILNKIGVLKKLEKYHKLLNQHIESFSENEKYLIKLSQIFIKDKFLFIGEDLFYNNYFNEEQRIYILNYLKTNFKIILLFNTKSIKSNIVDKFYKIN